MPFSNRKIKNSNSRRTSPFLVTVNKEETDNFMNDIMKEASKLNSNQKKTNYFRLFIQSFILGIFILCASIFFLYSAYYFISRNFLNS